MPDNPEEPIELVDEAPLDDDTPLAPGFYVNETGPYLTLADAQAFLDGRLDGEGTILEVK